MKEKFHFRKGEKIESPWNSSSFTGFNLNISEWIHTKVVDSTLQSKATDTSKTFMVPKVFILRNLDWFCLKAHNLPFIHAKFQSTGFSGLAST